MKQEVIARLLLVALVGAAVAIPLAPRLMPHGHSGAVEVELHARMPESGGWSQENINARVDQPIHLRMTSDDVVHSFAIGQDPRPAVDIHPGQFSETTLVFDKPGRYTYYCTRWCGPNHWRMRGTIEISGPSAPASETPAQPLYQRLGLNLDAPHPAEVTPSQVASAAHGAALASRLPALYLTPQAYKANSPSQTWKSLRTDPLLLDLSDADLWDLVAFIWQQNTSPTALQEGQRIYAQNCASCHGESGRGDGVMRRDLPPYSLDDMGHGPMRPPDFSDPKGLLGASPALLEGKIIRGGMGTGMPYWGPILTDEQIQAVIAYLYSFSQSLK